MTKSICINMIHSGLKRKKWYRKTSIHRPEQNMVSSMFIHFFSIFHTHDNEWTCHNLIYEVRFNCELIWILIIMYSFAFLFSVFHPLVIKKIFFLILLKFLWYFIGFLFGISPHECFWFDQEDREKKIMRQKKESTVAIFIATLHSSFYELIPNLKHPPMKGVENELIQTHRIDVGGVLS